MRKLHHDILPVPPNGALPIFSGLKSGKKNIKQIVIRDTREKTGCGWMFSPMIKKALKTGDYTLKGFEKILCIERKGCVAELAKNICQKRFWAELERMKTFPVAALVLEFDMNDIVRWPAGSGIPKYRWKFIKIKRNFILSSIKKIENKYPNIEIIFAGPDGKAVAENIFKKVLCQYG